MMDLNHKTRVLFSETVKISTGINGLFVFHANIDNSGKTNHKIIGNFSVSQPNPQLVHDIIFYFLTNVQFINWFLDTVQYTGSFRNPPNVIQYTNQVSNYNFEHMVDESGELFFVFNNRYSTVTSKEVAVHIVEEWDEIFSETDVVTTIPTEDKSLNVDAVKIIEESKHRLQIITPYIDMSLISELLTKKQQGVKIQIITRTEKEFKGKAKKDAFNYLQKNLKTNHKTNDVIHSRIIISDQEKIILSSADLTHDSLRAQFNAGIITKDPDVVKKIVDYFKIVWRKSTS